MNKIPFVLIFVCIFFLSHTKHELAGDEHVQSGHRSIDNRAFKAGEKTVYLVRYGIIDAGIASLEIKETETKIKGRELLHIVGIGKTRGITNFFFPVDDRYETFIDKESVFPWLFTRDVNEGGYKIKQTYKFFQGKNVVETQKGVEHKVPANVQDMISAAYYMRTMDLKNIQKGDIFNIKSFVDDEVFDLRVQYSGTEVIRIKSGKYRCMKFNPVIQVGRIFHTAEDLEVWVSDDENKIPILCKAKILIGSVKVELIDYQGLSNPLAKIRR